MWKDLYVGSVVYGSDTSGNPVGNHNPGYMLHPSNGSHFQRDGGNPLRIGRDATDGSLTEWYRQGALVGSVGTANGGDFYIGNDDTGVLFAGGSDMIIPWNPATPASRDNGISLGSGSHRFKDIYISGGIYMQGSTTAVQFDDYEEGSWNPSNNVSTNYAVYTKIGRLVYINVDVSVGSLSGSASFALSVPFSPADTYNTGSFNYQTTGFSDATISLESGGIYFRAGQSAAYWTDGQASGNRLIFNGFFHTAS